MRLDSFHIFGRIERIIKCKGIFLIKTSTFCVTFDGYRKALAAKA
jgi:hypothetical protein